MKKNLSKYLFVFAVILGVFSVCCNFVWARSETDIKVSVIVPVYNVEKYLAECINSIINQTLKEIEIICVNDGSTDSSLDILREYEKKDNRIKVINKSNGGISSARNAGIEAANGKYIAFVDSDDWVDLDAYEILYRFAKEQHADILCAGWRNVPAKKCGRKDCCPKFKVYNDWFKAKKKRESIISCNKLYKRSLIIKNNLRFNTAISYAEDECFNLCVYPLAKTIVSVPVMFYNYRVRETGATFSPIWRKLTNYKNVWKYVFKVWKSYNIKKSKYFKLFTYPLVYRDELGSFIKSCL